MSKTSTAGNNPAPYFDRGQVKWSEDPSDVIWSAEDRFQTWEEVLKDLPALLQIEPEFDYEGVRPSWLEGVAVEVSPDGRRADAVFAGRYALRGTVRPFEMRATVGCDVGLSEKEVAGFRRRCATAVRKNGMPERFSGLPAAF